MKSVKHKIRNATLHRKYSTISASNVSADKHVSEIKFKCSSNLRIPLGFQGVELIQTLPLYHLGPVWAMKFSGCGQLLATGGQDRILRVWSLISSHSHFTEMRNKYKRSDKDSGTPLDQPEEKEIPSNDVTVNNSGATSNVFPFSDIPFSEFRGELN